MPRIVRGCDNEMLSVFRKPCPARTIKLTVVGDKAVGKTSLLKTYCQGKFPEGQYVSTVFPFIADEDYVYSKSVNYSGIPLLIALWDRVYNRMDDDNMRSLQYDQCDGCQFIPQCSSHLETRNPKNLPQDAFHSCGCLRQLSRLVCVLHLEKVKGRNLALVGLD